MHLREAQFSSSLDEEGTRRQAGPRTHLLGGASDALGSPSRLRPGPPGQYEADKAISLQTRTASGQPATTSVWRSCRGASARFRQRRAVRSVMGCSGLDIFLAIALAGRRPCTWMISTAVARGSGTSANTEGPASDMSETPSDTMPIKAIGVVAVSDVGLLCPVSVWMVSGAALSALSDTGPAGVANV